jgi:triacylglycerol lipase
MAFPIILAHGIARFDFLGNKILHLDNSDDPQLDCAHYFKCIRTMLRHNGFNVWHSKVPFSAGVEVRSAALRDEVLKILKATGAPKVNIIAHSMGGLDARHMMFNDRNAGKIHEKIATLNTISTPHGGSPFAEWAIKHLPHLVSTLADLGLDAEGLKDCGTSACLKFNRDPEVIKFEAASGVPINTFAGASNFADVLFLLKPAFGIIDMAEGENDGLVSVESAKWNGKPHVAVWKATDHLNELGWWDPDQIADFESEGSLLRRIHANYISIAREQCR